jgi:hypothetical protein
MSLPPPPELDSRRRLQLRDEMMQRAQSWLPDWRPRSSQGDFVQALLDVSGRILSEVTQRLDKVPLKTFRGFLDWLGVRGEAARAAQMPVAFSLTAGSDPVDAPAAVQLQATTAAGPVIFETTQALHLVPANITSLVAADPPADAFYSPPPGVLSLEAPPTLPNEWVLKEAAPAGATQLQLEPALGLEAGLILIDEQSEQQYAVTAVQGDIVTISPPTAPAPVGLAKFSRSADFDPFSGTARNAQQHALYVGADAALNIQTASIIEVVNGGTLPPELTWSYSGTDPVTSAPGWVPLQAVPDQGRLFLIKGAGAVAETSVGGINSRWLQAVRAPAALPAVTTTEPLGLLVNCLPAGSSWPTAVQTAQDSLPPSPPIQLDGIATTTPLVLNTNFYPLGPQPRLFDAFYLGCQEAFSKPNAHVFLNFEEVNIVATALAAIELSATDHLAAGVGLDGRLHLLEVHAGAAATSPTTSLRTVQPEANRTPITLLASGRPGATWFAGNAYLTVSSQVGEVWRWTQPGLGAEGKWDSLQIPAKPATAGATVTDMLLVRSGTQLRVYALMAGRLYERDALADDVWHSIDAPQPIARIAPVIDPGAPEGVVDEQSGIACVSERGELLIGDAASGWNRVRPPQPLDIHVYPLVVRAAHNVIQCLGKVSSSASAHAKELIAFDPADESNVQFARVTGAGNAFAPGIGSKGQLVAILTAASDDGVLRPALWDPFDTRQLGFGDVPVGAAEFSGTPGRLRPYYAFPTRDGAFQVASVDPTLIGFIPDAPLTDAALLNGAGDETSYVVLDFARDAPQADLVEVTSILRMETSRALLLESARAPVQNAVHVTLYRSDGEKLAGNVTTRRRLRLSKDGAEPAAGSLLYVRSAERRALVRVESVVTTSGSTEARVAVVADDLPIGRGAVDYRVVLDAGEQSVLLRPAVQLNGLSAAMEAALATSIIQFHELAPSRQRALNVAGNWVVLASPWQSEPPASADVVTFGAFRQFDLAAATTTIDPKLSWEYWDGNSWWQIPTIITDTTDELLQSGVVEFCVPANIQQTEVVGRKNYWIRARLVSGDYGQESVTIVTSPPDSTGATTQTIQRDDSGITPPYIAQLTVTYQVCCTVTPDAVLTSDGGDTRDQTAANHSGDAIVESFVSLSTTLSRLGDNDGGRAVYLAFDTPVSGGPIDLLFVVEESDQGGGYPLQIDALIDGKFKRLTSSVDQTRGLSETGLVILTLGEELQAAELFGSPGYWLRVRPNPTFGATQWQPKISGVYLNGVMANATETQLYERLGSSDGSPNQSVTLARPPVLAGSLELRVLEPLEDEEIAQLTQTDPTVVRSILNVWPGPWVRWTEVVDPADSGPTDRVYSLDDTTGTIVFGDGVHGLIPPIGSDSIVAAQYKRGGGAAANSIMAWTALDVVTPLQGVDTVVAVDDAAGGADPQDPNTTVRFATSNLSMRDRAVTLSDFESMSLQFAPTITQTRADTISGGVRVVVVLGADQPYPSKAMLRALQLELTQNAAPAFSTPGAVQVVPPVIVPIRIDLSLTLSDATLIGTVSQNAIAAVRQLLDPGSGGFDSQGWPLGQLLDEADIAAALAGVADIDGVDSITIDSVDSEGVSQPLPATLDGTRLLQLAPDGVTVDFTVSTVESSA